MRYLFGGSRSDSRTLPSKVPLIGPTPTFSVALYSPGPSASSFSQPGIAFSSTAGSRKASQTCWRATGISLEPSIFMAPSALQRPDGRVHAGQPRLDGLAAGGVGEADVRVGAKVDARHGGNARLVQEERAHVGGAPQHPALRSLAKESGNVRERVERALGHHAVDPRHGVERGDDDVPAPIEL